MRAPSLRLLMAGFSWAIWSNTISLAAMEFHSGGINVGL